MERIPKSIPGYWVRVDKKRTLSATRTKSLTSEEMERARLRRELAEVKMECNFLKKQQRTSQKNRNRVRVHEKIPASLYPLQAVGGERVGAGIRSGLLANKRVVVVSKVT